MALTCHWRPCTPSISILATGLAWGISRVILTHSSCRWVAHRNREKEPHGKLSTAALARRKWPRHCRICSYVGCNSGDRCGHDSTDRIEREQRVLASRQLDPISSTRWATPNLSTSCCLSDGVAAEPSPSSNSIKSKLLRFVFRLG
jgi:hypothetical protein